MKFRTMIVLNEVELRNILMDHLVQQRIFKILGCSVQMASEVNGWGVGEVTPIPLRTGDTYGKFIKASTEILEVEFIPPPA